jgi:hypothetical protein
MFLAIVLPLGAASLRIGFLSYDPALSGQRFSTQLLDLASRALDTHPVAAAHEQPMRLRIASERELERLRSQPDTLPGTESPSEEIELSIDAVELVALQASTDIAAKVIADDRIVSEYLLARNGLDMLLICAIEPFDEFLRTRLMVLRRGETTFTSLFDRIAKRLILRECSIRPCLRSQPWCTEEASVSCHSGIWFRAWMYLSTVSGAAWSAMRCCLRRGITF